MTGSGPSYCYSCSTELANELVRSHGLNYPAKLPPFGILRILIYFDAVIRVLFKCRACLSLECGWARKSVFGSRDALLTEKKVDVCGIL